MISFLCSLMGLRTASACAKQRLEIASEQNRMAVNQLRRQIPIVGEALAEYRQTKTETAARFKRLMHETENISAKDSGASAPAVGDKGKDVK